MHGKAQLPQKIKISSLQTPKAQRIRAARAFCPFQLIRNFAARRGGFECGNELFFIFSDGRPVYPRHVRTTLRVLLAALDLNPMLYNTQSFREGRAVDMYKAQMQISAIKEARQWKSSAVYRYLKT